MDPGWTLTTNLGPPPTNCKHGVLIKRGHTVKNLKERFFITKPGNELYYYETQNHQQPKGVIILKGAEVKVFNESLFQFSVVDREPTRKVPKLYLLQAKSKDEMSDWVNYLSQFG